jgi:HD-like signal output (HDOD) protein
MKNRILFVDDESLVLLGLQRMLRPMRNDWDMDFVTSGALALERMAQAPFDVVVADMRMPGMSGAELLNEVMKLHPQTVRLILSGHADEDLVIKCVGITHQYLSKPCDPEALKLAVSRASRMGASLDNPRMKQLIGRIDRLPSIPSLYVEMVNKLQDPEVVLEDLAAIMAKDIAMTAKVLKLVNSAFFGLPREINSASEAVGYLGMNTLKTLVLTIHAFIQFENLPPGGFSLERLWNHSLDVAAAARQIAEAEGVKSAVIEEAFVAGMLHDIGQLVLAANLPAQYGAVMEQACARRTPLETVEAEMLGATHAEVGGYLLGLWGLPVTIVEAIALHHQPRLSTGSDFSALTAVHAAESLGQPPSDTPTSPDDVDLQYLDSLGMSGHVESWRQLAQKGSAPAFS